MALAIASGTEPDVIQKNNHNDTMTNSDTISWPVASTQVQNTTFVDSNYNDKQQMQYLSMAITITERQYLGL